VTIRIRVRNVEATGALRTHVEHRLRLALGRFAERIARVTVRFSAAEAGKRCQIDLVLRPRTLTVEDTDSEAFAALDHAVDRLSRTVVRSLERER
jgi:ribosomal subunit interface protein